MKNLLKISLCFLVVNGCGGNLLSESGNKTSDDAIYQDAEIQINKKNYDAAIADFQKMSGSLQYRTDVREAYASALAGKCGLDFITYFNSVSNANFSTSLMFFLMNQFTQQIVNPTYCTQAETVIKSIGATAALRSTSENLFMFILAAVKIGAYLRYNADFDGTNNLGDNDTDASFNACTSAPTSTQGVLDDTQATEIVTGIGLLVENVSALAALNVGSSITSQITTLTGECSTISTLLGIPNPCTITDASQVTAQEIKVIRSMIATGATTNPAPISGGAAPAATPNPTLPIGIGTCTNINVAACCP